MQSTSPLYIMVPSTPTFWFCRRTLTSSRSRSRSQGQSWGWDVPWQDQWGRHRQRRQCHQFLRWEHLARALSDPLAPLQQFSFSSDQMYLFSPFWGFLRSCYWYISIMFFNSQRTIQRVTCGSVHHSCDNVVAQNTKFKSVPTFLWLQLTSNSNYKGGGNEVWIPKRHLDKNYAWILSKLCSLCLLFQIKFPLNRCGMQEPLLGCGI